MPSDFEKQVRQKMEELDFVPGEPVWTKIEEQIRRKKDRRKLVVWLPLFLLLAGGTLLWLNQGQPGNKQSAQQVLPGTGSNTNKTSDAQTGQEGLTTKENTVHENVPVLSANNVTDAPIIAAGNKTSSGKKTLGIRDPQAAVNDTNTLENTVLPGTNVQNKINRDEIGVSTKLIHAEEQRSDLDKDPVSNKAGKEIKDSVTKDPSVIIRQDSAKTVAVPNKKYQNPKWRIAAVGAAGFSGLADGLTILNTEKSVADAFSTPLTAGSPPSLGTSYTPAAVKNGFSFSIGAAAIKQLSEKFRFSAGLEYNYMSNQMQVGQDSAGYIRTYSSNMAVSSPANNYTSHYHFISLPVDIAFQPFKKLALDISAGLSLQQLVGTDALVYRSQYRAYVADDESFTKTQLFSRFGLNYTVALKKHQLTFGPQLNYGLSNLQKKNGDTNLFSAGLRTAFVF